MQWNIISQIPQKQKWNQKLQAVLSAFYYNLLTSKITENCYPLLELKLTLCLIT